MSRGLLVLVASVFAWLACGGRTVGGPDGGSSSGGSSGAQASDDAEGPPVTCNPGIAGGSGGGNSCSVSATEKCSDGNTYRVDCSCPARMCTCGVSGSGSGGSVFNTAYAGCPDCTETTMLWAICGFPGQ
ncbi:MAG TPA: hypothetical protein VF765_23015 [Polyangiaceae bacterium]